MSGLTDRIEMLLETRGESRTQLAKIIGVNEGTIRGWIKGCEPSVYAIQKVAEHYGVTIEYLLTGKEYDDYERAIHPAINEQEKQLVLNYRKISDAGKWCIFTSCEVLAKEYEEMTGKMSG